MCLICMKYRRIILIIIIISPGQILLSYIANTSRTHACTHAHAHTRTPRWRSGFRCSMGRCRPFRWRQWPSLLHSNKHMRGRRGFPHVVCVFRVHKNYEQFETSPKMIEQELQFDNSDRMRFKENYSIDTSVCQCTHARARTCTHTRLEHASFTHMNSLLHLFF